MVVAGNSLVVHDTFLMRLTVFDLEGQLLNTYRLSDELVTTEKLISVLGPSRLLIYRPPATPEGMRSAFRIIDLNGNLIGTLDVTAAELFDVDDPITPFLVSSPISIRTSVPSENTVTIVSGLYSGRVANVTIHEDLLSGSTSIARGASVPMNDVYERVQYERGDPIPLRTSIASRQDGVFAYRTKRYAIGIINSDEIQDGVLYRVQHSPEWQELNLDTWAGIDSRTTYRVRMAEDQVRLATVNVRHVSDDGTIYLRGRTPDDEPVLAIGRLELP